MKSAKKMTKFSEISALFDQFYALFLMKTHFFADSGNFVGAFRHQEHFFRPKKKVPKVAFWPEMLFIFRGVPVLGVGTQAHRLLAF